MLCSASRGTAGTVTLSGLWWRASLDLHGEFSSDLPALPTSTLIHPSGRSGLRLVVVRCIAISLESCSFLQTAFSSGSNGMPLFLSCSDWCCNTIIFVSDLLQKLDQVKGSQKQPLKTMKIDHYHTKTEVCNCIAQNVCACTLICVHNWGSYIQSKHVAVWEGHFKI